MIRSILMVPMSTLSGISRSEIRIPECHLDRPLPLAVRDVTRPANGRLFFTYAHLSRRDLEGIAHLGERDCVAHFGPARLWARPPLKNFRSG